MALGKTTEEAAGEEMIRNLAFRKNKKQTNKKPEKRVQDEKGRKERWLWVWRELGGTGDINPYRHPRSPCEWSVQR